MIETQLVQDDWADPKRGAVKLADYAEQWITQRPGLRPSATQLYRRLLKNYVVPHLGEMPLNKITTAVVREWRATLISGGLSQTMVAKAYRLLRAILMTAVVEDRLVTRNPCQLRGADKEHSEERPVLSVAQVLALAELMPYRKYRVLIMLTAFCSLRWGESRHCVGVMLLLMEAGFGSARNSSISLDGASFVRHPSRGRAHGR
ncbi:MAG: N-terminal phage integrase SAM-like domain-containing protein [Actinomycetota bacterium]|nr:N-terminal phage integrase SAM-like domain-containing protein [Actinomycetota bacterium]